MSPRKPTVIRKLEGNPGRRPIPEEIFTVGRPRVPAEFSEEERELWGAIVRSLPVTLLTGADQSVLERMAIAWARFRDCQRTIKAVGLMVKGAYAPVRNPYIAIQKWAAEEMQACGNALGLSPVARSRITADNSADDDPLSLLLDGRRDGAYFTPAPVKKQNNN
jgi:P27 family predicted phage terminase small subunit